MALGNAITYRMPFGIPGAITRESVSTIEAQPYGSTAFASYGIPAVVSSGTVVPITTTGLVPYGFLVRPFPFQENVWPTNASLSSTPPTTGAANILKRGYIAVLVNSGTSTPNLDTQVYVYTGSSTGAHVLGGIEGTSGGNIQKIPGAVFTCAVDANNIAEVFYDNPGSLTATS